MKIIKMQKINHAGMRLYRVTYKTIFGVKTRDVIRYSYKELNRGGGDVHSWVWADTDDVMIYTSALEDFHHSDATEYTPNKEASNA